MKNIFQTVKKSLILILILKNRIIFLVVDKFLGVLFSIFGYHLLRKHYYLPIPEKKDLIYQKKTELIGLKINPGLSIKLLNNVIKKYKKEFNSFPANKPERTEGYYLLNSGFMAIDGNVYYSLIRHLKPKCIIEIGAGFSSLLASEAIIKNKRESGKDTKLILIEPYPDKAIKKGFNGLTELKINKVQDIELDFFKTLKKNDILFIDSTHVLRTGGDVYYEYCEILPRLNKDVYIHIHDISLPKPYPEQYFNINYFWNEQYLLQAFLMFNSRFEIIWPGNYLMTKYPDKMRQAFAPEYDLMKKKYPLSEPTSFWMKVR